MPDAAGIGIGADGIVGDAHRHPHSPFAAGSLADQFHDPGLLLVADGKGFARGIVAVLLHEGVHHRNGFPRRRAPLQRQVHQREIVQVSFRIPQLLTAVPGRFHDGHLLFVHQAHHAVGVARFLGDEPFGRDRRPRPRPGHVDPFTGRVEARGNIGQRRSETEAVAVVSAHNAPIGGSFLAHDQVGAGLCPYGGEKEQHAQRKEKNPFHMPKD